MYQAKDLSLRKVIYQERIVATVNKIVSGVLDIDPHVACLNRSTNESLNN